MVEQCPVLTAAKNLSSLNFAERKQRNSMEGGINDGS